MWLADKRRRCSGRECEPSGGDTLAGCLGSCAGSSTRSSDGKKIGERLESRSPAWADTGMSR
jgi:hypothetical protein